MRYAADFSAQIIKPVNLFCFSRLNREFLIFFLPLQCIYRVPEIDPCLCLYQTVISKQDIKLIFYTGGIGSINVIVNEIMPHPRCILREWNGDCSIGG